LLLLLLQASLLRLYELTVDAAAAAGEAAGYGEMAAEAKQQLLAAYQLRYGSNLSSELYSQLAALPVAKPVRQVAQVSWDCA
jgi:hypothetical protein